MTTNTTTDNLSLDQKPTHPDPTVASFGPPYDHSSSPSPIPSSHTAIPSTISSQAYRLIESARLGLTILGLLLGIIILSTSADVISEYNKTHLGNEFLLPLWGGASQDVRGEIAVLVGGAVIVFAGLMDLLVEKIYALRSLPSLHTVFSLLVPIAGLITSVVATALQYHINTSSTSSTLQSWSCQWKSVAITSPNFNMICKETRLSLYLTVLMIPLEVAVLGLAAARIVVGKKAGEMRAFERKG